jgi:hypothetical protein
LKGAQRIMVDWSGLAADVLRDQAVVSHNRRNSERVELPESPRVRIIADRTGIRGVGLVKDISSTGAGLVLGIEPGVGQFLVVIFEWGKRSQLALARVMHTTRVDQGMYRVGVEFYDELPITTEKAVVPEEWIGSLPAAI